MHSHLTSSSKYFALVAVFAFGVAFFLLPPSANAAVIFNHPNYWELNNGLVGYWSFDGKDISGSLALDRSGQGNNGTLTNGPTRTIGKLGQALSFDGVDDIVDLGTMGSLAPTILSSGSASLWFKTSSNSPQAMFGTLTTDNNQFVRLIMNFNPNTGATETGKMQFQIRDDGLDPFRFGLNFDTGTTDNRWHHLAVTWIKNSALATWFLDGNPQLITTIQSGTNTTFINFDRSMIIGAEQQASALNYFNGTLDDVRIYNRALSADEVKRLYRIGATLHTNTNSLGKNGSLQNGLVGYWSFDGKDISGNLALDKSGQGNDGTLTNGPTKTIGKLGQALSFDGVDDWVDTKNSPLNPSTTDFSASLWFKVIKFVVDDDGAVLTQLDDGQGGTGRVWIHTNNNGCTPHRLSGTFGGLQDVCGTTPLLPDTWYHAVLVKSGSGFVQYFLNGQPEVSATVTVESDNGALRFGAGKAGNILTTGLIDDVRLYNRALSADEIKRLYRLGATLHANTQINNNSLANGLVGWWTFDGKDMSGNTVYDRAGTTTENGTLGTDNGGFVAGGGPTSVIGKLGQALNFTNGNFDAVSLGTPAALSSLPKLTVTAWIKPRSLHNPFNAIFGKSYDVTCFVDGWSFNLQNQSGAPNNLDFCVEYGAITADRFELQSADNSIVVNQWQFVAATWDGTPYASRNHLYINGLEPAYDTVQDGNFGAGAHIEDAGRDAYIGNVHAGDGYAFDGFIDDVRVYNRVLSPDEIKRLYQIGSGK